MLVQLCEQSETNGDESSVSVVVRYSTHSGQAALDEAEIEQLVLRTVPGLRREQIAVKTVGIGIAGSPKLVGIDPEGARCFFKSTGVCTILF